MSSPHLQEQRQQREQQATPYWSYDDRDQCGPQKWPQFFQTGKLQSPINILVRTGEQAANLDSTCCTGRLRESLKISDASNEGNRSYSSSPTTSSSRSTPTQASGSDYFDDDDDDQRDDGFSERTNNKERRQATNMKNNQKKQITSIQSRQKTRFCVSNKKIFLGYPRYLNSLQLQNNGHSWQVTLPPELSTHTLLTGPSLGDREYRLLHFHCHWGENCDSGSEHQIDGKSFSAEIHFVHWNCTDFKSPEEASKHKHGLAVLGVLVQAIEGEQNRNRHLDKIICGLKSVQEAGSTVTLKQSRLDLKKLFPANRWFYATYEGSLTTPPLSEVVDWIVFVKPIQCSTSQIDEFRKIKCPGSGRDRLLKNCRPIQPSNDRLVSIWNHH